MSQRKHQRQSTGTGLESKAAESAPVERTTLAVGQSTDEPMGATLAVGDVLGGQYEIRSLLGQGKMGRIYEADDLVLKRRCAVKVAIGQTDPGILLREAQALAALRHGNLPVVYNAGLHEGTGFVAMERLYGIGLDEHIDSAYRDGRRISLAHALSLLFDLAEALSAIHGAGIVHRDVKPANVLLCPGRGTVLLDLGLVVPEFAVDETNGWAGTPMYMAPEMVERQIVAGSGHLADLYSLGVLAFELVTGKSPFAAENVAKMMMQHVIAEVPHPRSLRPDVPEALDALIVQLLSKDPSDRPPTADAVAMRLGAIGHTLNSQDPNRRSILIVDDDEFILVLLESYLRRWVPEVEIRSCRTGREALAELEKETPQMMLLDLQLPGMSGIELLMLLRGSSVALPAAIIGISGTARKKDVDLLGRLGVQAFVPKDGDLSKTLVHLVHNVFGTVRSLVGAETLDSETPENARATTKEGG